MSKYVIPEQYYFRIHHCRSRFKGDVENVLIFMATEISKLSSAYGNIDNDKLNDSIKHYPGNGEKTKKTIDNWRTEISSLFGLFEYENDKKVAGYLSRHLAQYQDMVEFFKLFLYKFQYPGAHIDVKDLMEQIGAGVKFKPAQYILSVLKYAEDVTGKRQYITKAEACHCIFNDLRCTRDLESPAKVWQRIKENRDNNVEYDETGDVIRYAGDILDYMEIANLLVCYNHRHFYSNYKREEKAVSAFLNSNLWFDKYDYLYDLISAEEDLSEKKVQQKYYREINKHYHDWFGYVNQEVTDADFRTNLLSLLSQGTEEYTKEKEASLSKFYSSLQEKGITRTKDTGDLGEDMIYIHECKRVRDIGRSDILHIIKHIPTQYAVGYDIQSVEAADKPKYKKRYIEVKTTLTRSAIKQANYRFHLTPNEISTADTVRENYYVYRLIVNKDESKLFVIKNPIQLFEDGLISMTDNNGADVSFDTKNARVGNFEELLTWRT